MHGNEARPIIDPERPHEMDGGAGVFGGDDTRILECLDQTFRRVPEIADGRRGEDEHPAIVAGAAVAGTAPLSVIIVSGESGTGESRALDLLLSHAVIPVLDFVPAFIANPWLEKSAQRRRASELRSSRADLDPNSMTW